jgi:hypothetical protein
MPSCPEAGQRAKLNRTCHSAQSSLLTFFQESLKKIKKLKKNKKRLKKTLKENIVFFKKQPF